MLLSERPADIYTYSCIANRLCNGGAGVGQRGGGGSAFSNLKPGMIIIVKQMGANSYAIRSIPEICGGFQAEEVQTGRVLSIQGGFDVVGSSYNRLHTGIDRCRCPLLCLAGGGGWQ